MKTFILDLSEKGKLEHFLIQVWCLSSFGAQSNHEDLGPAGLFVKKESFSAIQREIDAMLDSNAFKDDEQETTEIE
jgi:hypothetical protein